MPWDEPLRRRSGDRCGVTPALQMMIRSRVLRGGVRADDRHRLSCLQILLLALWDGVTWPSSSSTSQFALALARYAVEVTVLFLRGVSLWWGSSRRQLWCPDGDGGRGSVCVQRPSCSSGDRLPLGVATLIFGFGNAERCGADLQHRDPLLDLGSGVQHRRWNSF